MVNCDVICGTDEKWCGVPTPATTEWVSEVRTKIKFKKKMRENLEVF